MPSSKKLINIELFNELIIETERLIISRLIHTDTAFIYALLNTPGWLHFIGDRQINTLADAERYIQKITENNQVVYWKVNLKKGEYNIGIVTLLQRQFLMHPDIGFAFLPDYMGSGYAFEATSAIVDFLIQNKFCKSIMAITNADNENSIKLLLKLGMQYAYTDMDNKDHLLVYQMSLF